MITLRRLMALFLLLPLAAVAENNIDLVGSWQGSFQVGQQEALQLRFHITEDNNGLQATLDIPAQHVYGISATAVSLRNNQLLLRLPSIQAEFYGALQFGRDGRRVRSIRGDWSQSGEYVPLQLQRIANPAN